MCMSKVGVRVEALSSVSFFSALTPACNNLLTLSAAINPAVHFTPADTCFASSSCIIECSGYVGFKSLARSEFLQRFSVSDCAATTL